MTDYLALIPKPDAKSVNTGRSPLSQALMLRLLGKPSSKKTKDCGEVTNLRLASKIVTRDVGPFRVTGHKAAVNSLETICSKVKTKNPELYELLGTAGMLCCRLVRGSDTSWSNHSWGLAVDITIGGKLDPRGDDKVQLGLLALYPYFREAGWWWGVEFGIEDAMHFEVAAETVEAWAKRGLL